MSVLRRRGKEPSNQKHESTGLRDRGSPKLQVSALAKPEIASLSMQSILHFILKEVVIHD